jgi:hypothetical protein
MWRGSKYRSPAPSARRSTEAQYGRAHMCMQLAASKAVLNGREIEYVTAASDETLRPE